MKINLMKILLEMLNEYWWDDLSYKQQKLYVKNHPNTEKVPGVYTIGYNYDAIKDKKNKKFQKYFNAKNKNNSSMFANSWLFKKRIPNIKNNIDIIRDKKDLEHFKYKFIENANIVEDVAEYHKFATKQYSNVKSKLSKDQKKILVKYIKSWKEYGGYEAIKAAIEQKKFSLNDIKKRNKQLGELANNTIVNVKQPIERGLIIEKKDLSDFLYMFEIGENVGIPPDIGGSACGFSINNSVARNFSDVYDNDIDKTSIVIRILPNSKNQIKGLYIDGDTNSNINTEMELVRSSKSQCKVIKHETVKYPSGKLIKIITLQEPEHT